MHTTTTTWSPQDGWSVDPASVPASPGSSIALAFSDPQVDAEPALAQLRAALPGTVVIGCSTAGQILGNRVDPAPLVAAITQFSGARVASGFLRAEPGDGTAAGAGIGNRLSEAAGGEPIAGVMVFGGGLHTNGSALVSGLTAALPAGTAVSGGLAGDGPRFQHTWVHCDGESGEDCVAAFAVIGAGVEFLHGSQGGWDGFGPQRTITRSDGNVLYELDGQPALALYKEYLGERATELPSSALLFPLTVAAPDGSTTLVRTILAVDEGDQSMTFAGDMPQGWSARLMWTTMERLMEGAGEAAEDSAQDDAGLAVAISCVGRRLVLGARTDEELDSVTEVLGDDTPLVGFYSYGEIAPLHGMCSLHNQTMTITTIRERSP
jgi:hypothetical protein